MRPLLLASIFNRLGPVIILPFASALLLVLLSPLASFALDEDEIYKFEPCFQFVDEKGRAPNLPAKLESQLRSPKEFPSWGFPLAPYFEALLSHANRNGIQCLNPVSEPLPGFPPILRSVALVAQGTASIIQRDLDSQRRDLTTISECLKKSGNERCRRIVSFLVADLSDRMKQLRVYMALKDGEYTPGARLKHDIPYTRFISGIFFPNQKQWKESLSPLSAAELAELAENSRNTTNGRSPKDLYDQMLSTTPILLLLDESVTPASIGNAVETLLAGYPNELPFERLGQDIFLQTPYVARAIEELPKEAHFSACIATKAIFRNLKTQYETLPKGLAGLGLLGAIPAGAAAMGGRVFFQQLMNRSAISISGLTTMQVAGMTKRYLEGMRYCSAIYRQKNPAPDVDGVCTLGKMNQLQADAEIIMLINIGFFGAMKSAPYLLKLAK